MSNTLGTLSGNLILTEALDLVFQKRPLLKFISLGLNDIDGKVDSALKDQTVYTRLKSIPTVQDFGTGSQAYTATDVPVTLSNFKECHVAFTAAEANSTDRNLIKEAAEPMAVSIANHMVDAIAGLVIAANFAGTTAVASATPASPANKLIVASGWSAANTIIPMRQALNNNGTPRSGRYFVYNGNVEAALLQDQSFMNAYNLATNGRAIESGSLPNVFGFAMDDYPALPSNSQNLVGWAATPDALACAIRAPKNPTEYSNLPFPGVIGYVQATNSPLRMLVTQWIDPTTLAVNNRFVFLYGIAKGATTNLVRLVTA